MQPTTMYGCNKLYCEQLGTYYARHYKQLAAERASGRVDFRCVRFPGPDLRGDDAVGRHVRLRAGDDPRRGARASRYNCFVRPDTRIPFMAMPDGVDALLTLAAAPRERLTRTAYNVAAFNPSAERGARRRPRGVSVRADRLGRPTRKRQGIVDSWPADVDDSAARRDWGFAPRSTSSARSRTT